MKLNYQVVEDNGHLYIEFLDEFGKVKFGREFYGGIKEDFNDGLFSQIRPHFKLLDNEETISDDRGNIYIMNKRTGEIK